MLKNLIVAALLATTSAATLAQTPASTSPASPVKKELVNRVLEIQRSAIEGMGRAMAEQPAAMLMQQAGPVLQQRVAAERREIVGREIEADVRKYVDETVPLMRDLAMKLAPGTIGAQLEEKMDEAELRQLLAALESPAFKKFQSLSTESQRAFANKLMTEARPVLEPRARQMEQTVGRRLGLTNPGAAASGPAAAPKK